MLKTLSAASLTLLLTGVAAPALAQSADWSGPYVGVYGGFLESDEDKNESLIFDRDFDGEFDDTVITAPTATPPGANAFSPGSCSGAASGSAVTSICDDDGGGIEGGARIGYDMQFGSFVLGAVADISAVDLEDSVASFSTTPASYTFTRNLEHVAGLRARLGYAAGNVMFYGTGGVAYGKVDNKFATDNGANGFTERVDEDQADGYQFGGGLEWAVAPNLKLVGEYLYTSLEPDDYIVRAGQNAGGTTPATNPFILPPNTVGTDFSRSNDEMNFHAFRLGFNVSF